MHRKDLAWGGGIILFGAALFFAFQTAELIWTLYTSEIWYMKVVMVAAIDGFCAIWYVAKLFYPFKVEDNYHKAVFMFRLCFWISALCSVIQMNLLMDTRLHMNFDPAWLVGGFWAATLCFIINLAVFSKVVESERGVPSIDGVNYQIPASIKKN